jgi:tetratricopeptide (TPR) repeat protein
MIKQDSNITDMISRALILEREGELYKAVDMYEAVLKLDRQNQKVLARLMTLYRKLKKYRKEIRCIDQAINFQEQLYKPPTKKEGVISNLSNKLNVLLGLKNKKGHRIFLPGQIARLQKRKELILKKIKS